MRILIAIAASLSFSQIATATMKQGEMSISTDISYTSARELWKGRDAEINFHDTTGETHPDGVPKSGRTEYINFGLGFSVGLPAGIQTDLRLDYTSSKMYDGTHPNEKHGGEGEGDSRLSGAGIKFLMEAFANSGMSLTPYLGYKHPGKTEPEAPTFLAVNDFSTHLDLGLKTQFNFSDTWMMFLDTKYTVRSKQTDLHDEGLPADQGTVKLDLLSTVTPSLSLGGGLVYLHTVAGPDISTPAFGANLAEVKHPPFYAARERFLATVAYLTYYCSSDSWIGFSQFEKVWGRNTDRSRTFSLFSGWSI